MSLTPVAEVHVRWPCERFYWGVLDASILPRRLWQDTERLGYLFEPVLPCPIDDLHAVYHPLRGRRYIACAADRAVLSELPPGTVTLAPATLPSFLGDEIKAEVDLASLNLLTGPFLPGAVRSAERRWRATAAGAALLLFGIAALGLERRAEAALGRERRLARAANDVQLEVLGPAAARSPLPLPLQLEAELRTLRRTRSDDVTFEAPRDASLDLAVLLSRWPKNLRVETDSLHVTDRSLHVQARFPSSGDAQSLADALSDLAGWRLLQPSLQVLDGGVRATIQLQREEARKP